MDREIEAEFRRRLGQIAVASNIAEASRQLAWTAFDLATSESDPLRRRALAEKLCEAIAVARDVKPQGLPVYRQRAREMMRYHREIGVSPREKADPMTLAKVFARADPNRGIGIDRKLIEAVLNTNEATRDAIALIVRAGVDGPSGGERPATAS